LDLPIEVQFIGHAMLAEMEAVTLRKYPRMDHEAHIGTPIAAAMVFLDGCGLLSGVHQ